MNIRTIQQSLLCVGMITFSLSYSMDKIKEMNALIKCEESINPVIWKSPVTYSINGNQAYAELRKYDNEYNIDLRLLLINREKEKYEGIIHNEGIDFIVMKKEGPGFDEDGLPYMHAYGPIFNNVFEATLKVRKKIKQLLMVKKTFSYHTQSYACTYELKPFDPDFSWSRGEMEDFYNFPVLLKAFLHSFQKRYDMSFDMGNRCYYLLKGVVLPPNYKKVRKNPNTDISKYTSYDELREEVRKMIDEHYEKQQEGWKHYGYEKEESNDIQEDVINKAIDQLCEQHQNQKGCAIF